MLANKALLVCVSISQWGARKKDKKASASVENTFKSGRQAGSYNKKLLPGAKELEAVSSLAGSIRNYFYENTLPWLSDGTRILASKNYVEFNREFQSKHLKFIQAVNDFLAVYPTLKAQAQSVLGELFDANDYPSEDRIRQAFSCDIVFLPMPQVGDFRVEVATTELASFNSKMLDIEREAVEHCFNKLADVIKTAVEKLASPSARFQDSLFSNITDLCEILPRLNVTENPALEKTRLELKDLVASINPESCRKNLSDRDLAAKNLRDISAKMGSFMGSRGE
jgi:hypothetical protein